MIINLEEMYDMALNKMFPDMVQVQQGECSGWVQSSVWDRSAASGAATKYWPKGGGLLFKSFFYIMYFLLIDSDLFTMTFHFDMKERFFLKIDVLKDHNFMYKIQKRGHACNENTLYWHIIKCL